MKKLELAQQELNTHKETTELSLKELDEDITRMERQIREKQHVEDMATEDLRQRSRCV